MVRSVAEKGGKRPWYKKERGKAAIELQNDQVVKGDEKDGAKNAEPAPANMANFIVLGLLYVRV